jgi:hypothetical protein
LKIKSFHLSFFNHCDIPLRLQEKPSEGDPSIGCFKPGALHPVPTSTFKALTCFWIFGRWPKIQATRYACGRWLTIKPPHTIYLLRKGCELNPNPDKPGQIATKAPRHKAKPLVNIHLCVFVSWWRKCFAIKCKEFTICCTTGLEYALKGPKYTISHKIPVLASELKLKVI